MKSLLDLNILFALTWSSHIHHESAHQWFKKERGQGWATCPITQSGLVRLSSNKKILAEAVTPTEAYILLNTLVALPDHQFLADSIPLNEAIIFQQVNILGHRQITDAYLLSLAIYNEARLISFDKGLKQLCPKQFSKYLLVLEG